MVLLRKYRNIAGFVIGKMYSKPNHVTVMPRNVANRQLISFAAISVKQTKVACLVWRDGNGAILRDRCFLCMPSVWFPQFPARILPESSELLDILAKKPTRILQDHARLSRRYKIPTKRSRDNFRDFVGIFWMQSHILQDHPGFFTIV